MRDIFQKELAPELLSEVRLPGISPCAPQDWLRVDDAYASQMAYRALLLATKRDAVLWQAAKAEPAALEVLDETLALLPSLGFRQDDEVVECPDGRRVKLDRNEPLLTLGHLVQQDLCILEAHGDEHVLTAAVLCFPASWRLADKAGKPLLAIHAPVNEYNADLGRRVQRLFDGIKVGKPLQRHNYLRYADSDLHQPHPRVVQGQMPYIRSERQCLVRLPRTKAVLFTIHTWMIRAQEAADV